MILAFYIFLLTYYSSAFSKTAPHHPFVRDLQEKSELFDQAATKYSAKVSA